MSREVTVEAFNVAKQGSVTVRVKARNGKLWLIEVCHSGNDRCYFEGDALDLLDAFRKLIEGRILEKTVEESK